MFLPQSRTYQRFPRDSDGKLASVAQGRGPISRAHRRGAVGERTGEGGQRPPGGRDLYISIEHSSREDRFTYCAAICPFYLDRVGERDGDTERSVYPLLPPRAQHQLPLGPYVR